MAAQTKVGSVKNSWSLIKYLKDVRAEFRKITWPTRDEIFSTTGVVLTTMVIFTLIVWLFDSVFGFGLNSLLSYLKVI